MNLHTDIFEALQDPSTWASISGVIAGANMDTPYAWLIVLAGIIGVIMKWEPKK